jgi:hypothetical protein
MLRAVLTCLALALGLQGEPEWSYVVPPQGDPLRRPQLCALPLTAERPAELKVNVEFRGAWQRYGSLRFGDPDSTRIAVVLDHRSAREIDLYVDSGRDLEIGARDLAAGDGPSYELSLAVATRDADGRDVLVPRRVALELGESGAILATATLGWLEGRILVGGESVRVLRRDADSNGFFGDARDQLWLDRDQSGDFAPLRELFVVQPILALGTERFAVRSDRLGASLRLDRLEGSGTVRLALPGPNGAPREDLVDLQALLVGRDGSAALARAPGNPTEVPVGEYRLGMVTVRLADPKQGQPWSYVFSSPEPGDKVRWHAVGKDAQVAIDPLGELELALYCRPEGPVAAGDSLTLRPDLRTVDGLYINTAYRGREAPAFSYGSLSATVELLDARGLALTTSNSGFA